MASWIYGLFDVKQSLKVILLCSFVNFLGFMLTFLPPQLNEITPYIDGGLVYGVAKAWTDTLRAFEDGLMAADQGKHREDTVSNTFPIVNTIRLPMANPPTPYYHELRRVSRHFSKRFLTTFVAPLYLNIMINIILF